MNKEDINKIHELIKSDDSSNKLLGFTIGRQIGLSDLELFNLTNDGGLLYHSDVSRNSHEFLNINGYNLWFYYGIKISSVYRNHKLAYSINSTDNESKLKAFSYFLNLII